MLDACSHHHTPACRLRTPRWNNSMTIRPLPADDAVMIECPLCGEEINYGAARGIMMYPAGVADDDSPGALRGVARLSCRCGRTNVDIQQRGSMRIALPQPGITLGESSGPDASVIF
jgi:hypothetical protein